MERFALPREYDAVFVAGGTFQLLVSPDAPLASLSCIRDHLAPEGFLLPDLFVPWDDIIAQRYDEYHVTRGITRPDGTRGIVLERFAVDLARQVKQGTYRYEFYRDGRLVECLAADQAIRWYWKDEFLTLLRAGGFSRVNLLSDSPLHSEGHSFVFQAFR